MTLKDLLPLRKRLTLWFVYKPLMWCSKTVHSLWMTLSYAASDVDDYIWKEVDHDVLFDHVLAYNILECTFKSQEDAERALLRYSGGSNARVIRTWSIETD